MLNYLSFAIHLKPEGVGYSGKDFINVLNVGNREVLSERKIHSKLEI
jgi:hypothetical protein